MKKNAFIETNLHAYDSFFDRKWARDVLGLAEGSPLEPVVFDLLLSWRLISNAHRLPALVVMVAKSAYSPVLKEHRSGLLDFTKMFTVGLVRRMRDVLSPAQLMKLDFEAKEVMQQLEPEIRRLDGLSAEGLWDGLIQESEMRMSILGAQRLNYSGVYFAYEDFLATVYRCVCGEPDYRIYGDRFAKGLTEMFGEETAEYCWTCDEVNLPRLIRNAIVHNGARFDPRFEAYRSQLHLLGNEIQVSASDTRNLFETLTPRVKHFINVALPR